MATTQLENCWLAFKAEMKILREKQSEILKNYRMRLELKKIDSVMERLKNY